MVCQCQNFDEWRDWLWWCVILEAICVHRSIRCSDIQFKGGIGFSKERDLNDEVGERESYEQGI